jgi:hypothetical protein
LRPLRPVLPHQRASSVKLHISKRDAILHVHSTANKFAVLFLAILQRFGCAVWPVHDTSSAEGPANWQEIWAGGGKIEMSKWRRVALSGTIPCSEIRSASALLFLCFYPNKIRELHFRHPLSTVGKSPMLNKSSTRQFVLIYVNLYSR